MMISSPSAGDRYAAAAALDRALRSGADKPDDADADGPPDATTDSSPDVVVTLSRGGSAPSTYDASGRMAGPPTLDELGANGPDSMAHASESDADGDTASADEDATATA